MMQSCCFAFGSVIGIKIFSSTEVSLSKLIIVIRNSHLAYIASATRKSRDPTLGTTVGRQPIQL